MKSIPLKVAGGAVAACLLAAACGPSPLGSVPGGGASGPQARPVKDLGVICPVEAINGKSVRTPPDLGAGSKAIFMGWATVADYDQPVPPMVHLVLRPQGVKDAADIYLELGHMPRPDLSNEPKRRLAGFEGQVTLPAAGRYEVLVALGDKDWQVVCDSGTSIAIVAGK